MHLNTLMYFSITCQYSIFQTPMEVLGVDKYVLNLKT